MAILMPDPSYFNVGASGQFNKITDLIGGPNMASIHLAQAMGDRSCLVSFLPLPLRRSLRSSPA